MGSGGGGKNKSGVGVREEESLPDPAVPRSDAAIDKGEELSETSKELQSENYSYSPSPAIARYLVWKRRRETWVPVVTLVVSVVALAVIALQAIVYWQQRKVMDQQVQQSERGLQISERAYVGVASLVINLDRKEILMMIENIGKVPANNVIVVARVYRLADELSGSAKYFDAGGVQLFPGSLKMRVSIPLPASGPEKPRDIATHSEGFFVAGTIKYEDGFGKLDTTNFAFKYNPPPNEGWTADSNLVKYLEKSLEPMQR